MKTKKLIAVALLAAIGTTAQAQDPNPNIVTSKSQQVIVTQEVKPEKQKKPKKPKAFKWNAILGFSFDMLDGNDWVDWKMAPGFDAEFGFMSSPNQQFCYGLGVGVMTHGAKIYERRWATLNSIGFDLTPKIAYSFSLSEDSSILPYLGPFIGYQFSGKLAYDGKGTWGIGGHLDAGVNVGVDFFFTKSFFADLHLKKSFTNSGGVWREDTHSMKAVVGIGYQLK